MTTFQFIRPIFFWQPLLMIGAGIFVYLMARAQPEAKGPDTDFVTQRSWFSSRTRINTTNGLIMVTLGVLLLIIFNLDWISSFI